MKIFGRKSILSWDILLIIKTQQYFYIMTTFLKVQKISATLLKNPHHPPVPQTPHFNHSPSPCNNNPQHLKLIIKSRRYKTQHQQYILRLEVNLCDRQRDEEENSQIKKKGESLSDRLVHFLHIDSNKKDFKQQKLEYSTKNIDNNLFIISEDDYIEIMLKAVKNQENIQQIATNKEVQTQYLFLIAGKELRNERKSYPYSLACPLSYKDKNNGKAYKQFEILAYEKPQNYSFNPRLSVTALEKQDEDKYLVKFEYLYKYDSNLIYAGCFGNKFIPGNSRQMKMAEEDNNDESNFYLLAHKQLKSKIIEDDDQGSNRKKNCTIFDMPALRAKARMKSETDDKSLNVSSILRRSLKKRNKKEMSTASTEKVSWKGKPQFQQPIVSVYEAQKLNIEDEQQSKQSQTDMKIKVDKISLPNQASNSANKKQDEEQSTKSYPKLIQFFKGPCKSKNLFSCLDGWIDENEIRIIQPHYL